MTPYDCKMTPKVIDLVRAACSSINLPLSLNRSRIAALLLASLLASGCAANRETQEMTSRCQSDDRAACAELDDQRQARDEADYQGEPALGYLNLPVGIFLPMPIAARNSSNSSM